MNKPFISLCPEITRANALTLMDWLEDEGVTRYLSDSRHVSRFIEQVIGRVQLPILTHLFNQGGRFFMAYDQHDVPVGFVRLVKAGPDCEMVLVIGNRDNWGRKLGAGAIREGMKLAFFDMRAEKLIAKIHPDNGRSIKASCTAASCAERAGATLRIARGLKYGGKISRSTASGAGCRHDELQGLTAGGRREAGSCTGLPRGCGRPCRETIGKLHQNRTRAEGNANARVSLSATCRAWALKDGVTGTHRQAPGEARSMLLTGVLAYSPSQKRSLRSKKSWTWTVTVSPSSNTTLYCGGS